MKTSQHVRISKLGREILNNHELARKLMAAIVENSRDIDVGKTIKIDGYSISSATRHSKYR